MKRTLKGSQTVGRHQPKILKNPDENLVNTPIVKLAVKLADDLLTGVGWLDVCLTVSMR